jgi:hypothetical protein
MLTQERDRLVRQKEAEMKESRMKERVHYTSTLAKLRSEGLHR